MKSLTKATKAARYAFGTFAPYSTPSVIDFCPRNPEEQLRMMARLPQLIQQNPSHIQISDLHDRPQALFQSISTLQELGYPANNIVAHVSHQAHKTRKTENNINSFKALRTYGVKEFLLVSGIMKSGGEIARSNNFFNDDLEKEFRNFVADAVNTNGELPKFALTVYPNGHLLSNRTNSRHLEFGHLKRKIEIICDVMKAEPEQVISKLVFQHSFSSNLIIETHHALKHLVGDSKIEIIPTVLHLGNEKVVHAFSNKNLSDYPENIKKMVTKLREAKTTKEHAQLQEEANLMTLQLVEEITPSFPKILFYVENDLDNLVTILDQGRKQGLLINSPNQKTKPDSAATSAISSQTTEKFL